MFLFTIKIIIVENVEQLSTIELPITWHKVESSSTSLVLAHIITEDSKPKIKYSVIIKHNLTCSLSIYGKPFQQNYATIKRKIDLLSVLRALESMSLCIGNNDPQFMNIAMEKNGRLCDRAGRIIIVV